MTMLYSSYNRAVSGTHAHTRTFRTVQKEPLSAPRLQLPVGCGRHLPIFSCSVDTRQLTHTVHSNRLLARCQCTVDPAHSIRWSSRRQPRE
jgi:hypothetical protein